jgi:hypothetical protein
MNMNTSLRVAVVMLLGTSMQGAFAASPTSPIKIASEVGTSAAELEITGSPTFEIPVIRNREIKADTTSPVSSQPYYVVITLTGGARFGSVTALSLQCGYTATNNVGALTDAPAATTGGTVAGFRLANGSLTGSCVLTFGSTALTLVSGANKDYGIKVEARHFDSYDGVSATTSGTVVSFTQGMQASVEQGRVTIDVGGTSLSKKFLVAGTVSGFVTPAVTAVALLGTLKYNAVSDVKQLNAALVPANNTYLGNFALTVTGAPLAAFQETAVPTGTSAVTGGVYLSSDKCATSATPGGEFRFTSGTQVSFTTLDAARIDATNGLSVCALGNNVAAIDRGTVNFTLSAVMPRGVGMLPNLDLVDTTLVKVEKNGTSLKVLNLPPPDYTVDQAFVRFYNMGTTTGKVLGTLYSQGLTDGTNTGGGLPLGSTNVTLIDSIAPGVVTVLSGQMIAAKFGQTTWPGRAWLQVESEVRGLRVQALIRSGGYGGTLTNMSDRVMLDGESVSRTE